MKIILYVFSGTGNTLKVAALYKKYLEKHEGNSVKIYRISKKSGKFPRRLRFGWDRISYSRFFRTRACD